MKQVGILVFDEVEVLDFAGPFEVFSVTEAKDKSKLFQVTLLGTKPGPVRARNGLTVVPHQLYNAPGTWDLLVVPGGYGAERLAIQDQNLISWLGTARFQIPVVASVCTGAFLLAEAGLLDGLSATTHHLDFDEFGRRWPQVSLVRDRRWVDMGPVATSGGISAGIDLALHLVSRLEGHSTAQRTAARMEYRWQEEP